MADIDAKTWLESVTLDEDDMSSNSNTDVCSQQSIKAYTDSKAGSTLTAAEVYADAQDATTLASAEAYTDAEIIASGFAHPRDHALSLLNFHDVKINDVLGVELQTTQYDYSAVLPAANPSIPGVATPDWAKLSDNGAGSTGVYCHAFSPTTEEEIFRNVIFPTRRRRGRNVYPLFFFTVPTASVGTEIIWGIEYLIGDSVSMTVNPTQFAFTTSHLPAVDYTPGYYYIAQASTIVMPSDDLSAVGMRIFRDATNVADTYPYDAYFIACSLYYHVDAIARNWSSSMAYPF